MGIAGEANLAGFVANTLALIGDDTTNVIVADAGHYPAEEAPDAVLAAVADFLDG